MLKKNYIFILICFITAICAVSSVSATDDADNLLLADETVSEDIVTNCDEGISDVDLSDVETQETLSTDETDSLLSLGDTGNEKLSSPEYTDYNVTIFDNTIHAWQNESVRIYIEPNTGDSYAYDFYLNVYNSSGNNIFYKNIYSYNEDTYYDYTFTANQLPVGIYIMELENYEDGYIFSRAILNVTDDPFYATISAGNYNANYYSGTTYSIKVTEQGTGAALSGVKIKVVFSKTGSSVTKYYTSGSDGMIKFTPPVGVGTWQATISSGNAHVIADSIKRTVIVKKAPVTMKAYKASAYKGYKLKLKATVKSAGKNVNEGTVTFKINGKSYKVAVKNGVATKTLKLKKIKKYKYTAKFTSSNFNSKKVKSTAVVKKRYATKVIVKNQKGYYGNKKTITVKVKTKSGKKVKDGWIEVVGTGSYSKVKNGKAKLYVTFQGNYQGYSGLTLYYKKTVSSKYKLKYVPNSLKYKSSSKKIKITSKFRCDMCGKKTTHSHYYNGYNIKIKVY